MAALALAVDNTVAAPVEGPVALSRLRRQYQDYIGSKRAEQDEALEAERYYHAAHWTAAEIKTLNERNQPVVTYNRVGRKIDGIVGLLERLRQDPKAYPRTPKQEDGAELATATLRYALDVNDWRSLSPDVGHDGAVKGLGGLELELKEGDTNDPNDRDVGLLYVDPRDFFYDPRSVRPDFSDARYMGTAKWVDIETAIELAPDMEAELRNACGGGVSGFDQTTGNDREFLWTNVRDKRVRLVDHWYRHQGEWHWTLYTGALRLSDGVSPFVDEKGRTICKFLMFSNGVDHDGDRYGFVRNLKGPQDEINQRRSKGLHLFNSRRLIMEEGAVQDVELTRREAAKADGVIVKNRGYELAFDDAEKAASAAGNLNLLQEAKAELENFGPNPALIGEGTGVAGSSGRAIALLQQAGIAELGPFILRYRGWKLRVYRALWSAIQRNWTAQRWVRVTDNEELGEFLAVNEFDVDPMTGQPVLVNALGNLDVDIILDEGPDQVNSMADAYDTLIALSQRGTPVPPDIILELSSLPGSVKKRLLQKIEQAQQPPPEAQMGARLDLENKAADAEGKKARAAKDTAEAVLKAQEAQLAALPFTGLAPPMGAEQPFMGP